MDATDYAWFEYIGDAPARYPGGWFDGENYAETISDEDINLESLIATCPPEDDDEPARVEVAR